MYVHVEIFASQVKSTNVFSRKNVIRIKKEILSRVIERATGDSRQMRFLERAMQMHVILLYKIKCAIFFKHIKINPIISLRTILFVFKETLEYDISLLRKIYFIHDNLLGFSPISLWPTTTITSRAYAA